MLQVRISNAEGQTLYEIEIRNTPPTRRKADLSYGPNYAAYTAKLSGPSLREPLIVRLNKFNRELGAVKLTVRMLERFFRQHMDQLVDLSWQTKKYEQEKTRETR